MTVCFHTVVHLEQYITATVDIREKKDFVVT